MHETDLLSQKVVLKGAECFLGKNKRSQMLIVRIITG